MRKLSRTFAVLLAVAGCGDDDATQPSDPSGMIGIDAGPGVTPDASAADASSAVDAARSDPSTPPPTLNGKKLYTVRFDSRAGDQPFACGKKVTVGTKNTVVEPLDMRFYVHDVTLIRANGERVPLELHQDQRHQRENVALLDFADDTGQCLTGDANIWNVVNGYAPEQSDYTGLAFTLGVPADKNHLNAAEAPAPYNASGLWWSWSSGYKYARIDVTSDVLPEWYFHGGATECSGALATGFTCKARNLAKIELSNYDPQASLVVFDAARFYATSDLTVADSTPGCMGFKPDEQCAPLYKTLGLTIWDDATPGPQQTAFVLTTGPALVTSKSGAAPASKTSDPNAWPDPTFKRPAAFNVDNVSKAADKRSHPPEDPRWGANCMRCHQDFGPGLGKFSAAGTIVDAAGKPASGVKVELFAGDRGPTRGTFLNIVSHAILESDANGNFFTTAPLPLPTTALSARILGADGQPVSTMPFAQGTAACNNCHTGAMRLTSTHTP